MHSGWCIEDAQKCWTPSLTRRNKRWMAVSRYLCLAQRTFKILTVIAKYYNLFRMLLEGQDDNLKKRREKTYPLHSRQSTSRLASGYLLIWGTASAGVHCKSVFDTTALSGRIYHSPPNGYFASWDEPFGYAKPKLALNQVLHVIILFLWKKNKGRIKKIPNHWLSGLP